MYTIKNILVTTDYSDFSAAAIEYASSLAQLHGAMIHLVHVVEPLTVGMYVVELSTPSLVRELEEKARDEMRTFVYWKLKNNDKMEQVILSGEPYKEVSRYAKEHGIDLIVIATHGRTGLAHMMMGSVAEKVLRYSPVPVLSVKPLELREHLLKHEEVDEDLHVPKSEPK